MLDLLIRNGMVVDGSGALPRPGCVGVKDGIIVHVGEGEPEARERVDAGRQVIAPGFIDGHTHSDVMIFDSPLSDSKIRQGVTTEVVGNCGLAPAPLVSRRADDLARYVESVVGSTRRPWSWTTVGDYIKELSASRHAVNVATYVAHGSLRIAAMGFGNRPATPTEMSEMKSLLEEGLSAGAIGLSIGLLYAPGSYTSKEEIAELCSVLPRHGGLLAAHVRGEGNSLLESLREAIWIAERAGVPLEVSHLKAAGKRNWGKVGEAIDLIEAARGRSLDVACDVYPYDAGSTMLTTILPPWALEGGIGATLERISRDEVRARLREELRVEQRDWDNLVASTGWQSVIVSSALTEAGKACIGKSILDLSEAQGVDPVDRMIDLLLAEQGRVSIVYYHMSQDDVDRVVAYGHSIVVSDSLGCVGGTPHPRACGTFPRLFARYVREKHLLSIEEAVRKVTSAPARRFRLGKRGLLAPGCRADIVVFDPPTIRDGATYLEPTLAPDGISHVWVNGTLVMSNGRHSGALPGAFIRASE